MIKVGVVGASGYTGTECVRLLAQHPHVSDITVFANTLAGTSTDAYFGSHNAINATFLTFSPDEAYDIDVLFLAIPHKTSHAFMQALTQHRYRVIDLSADFRLQSPELYKRYYETAHESPDLLPQIPYGLPEYHADAIQGAKQVANPGCFAITSILALKPLSDAGKIKQAIIDAKSGASGAGKAINEDFLYCEVNESMCAYNTNTHRHMAELDEQCGCPFIFSPHVVPMNRGILAACYIETHDLETIDSIAALYQEAYAQSPCVRIRTDTPRPSTTSVVGTNVCDIHITSVTGTQVIVFSAIDNLIKGAAGNAIQVMNIMQDFKETAGLPLIQHRV